MLKSQYSIHKAQEVRYVIYDCVLGVGHDSFRISRGTTFKEKIHLHTKPDSSYVNTVRIFASCGVNASIFADVSPEGELEARLSCRDSVQIVGNGEALNVRLDGIPARIESTQQSSTVAVASVGDIG